MSATTTSVTTTPVTGRQLAADPPDLNTKNWFRDVWVVFAREIRPLLRDPFQVVFSMIQPLFFLALFAPLLPDAIVGDSSSALQWFVPAMVSMSCLMGASMVGSNLLLEIQTGSHERMLVAPIRRSALLVGRAGKEIVPMVAQVLIIVAVVTPFSFDLHPLGIAAGIALLAVFAVGIAALSYALALAASEREWTFWAVQQTLLFPILLLAGVLLPVDNGPAWLRTLSAINPMTYVVDAERALFAGQWPVGDVLAGFGAAGAVAAVGLLVGIRAMRRSA